MEGFGIANCTFPLATALTTGVVHPPGMTKMGTQAVCLMEERRGETRARCQMGGREGGGGILEIQSAGVLGFSGFFFFFFCCCCCCCDFWVFQIKK